MPTLSKSRAHAFHAQSGRCYYCDKPMWLDNPDAFAAKHGLRPTRVAHLRATAEHLLARCDGGADAQANIAAAHEVCNRRRHQRKKAPSPEGFRALVLRRLQRNCWHDPQVLRLQG